MNVKEVKKSLHDLDSTLKLLNDLITNLIDTIRFCEEEDTILIVNVNNDLYSNILKILPQLKHMHISISKELPIFLNELLEKIKNIIFELSTSTIMTLTEIGFLADLIFDIYLCTTSEYLVVAYNYYSMDDFEPYVDELVNLLDFIEQLEALTIEYNNKLIIPNRR